MGCEASDLVQYVVQWRCAENLQEQTQWLLYTLNTNTKICSHWMSLLEPDIPQHLQFLDFCIVMWRTNMMVMNWTFTCESSPLSCEIRNMLNISGYTVSLTLIFKEKDSLNRHFSYQWTGCDRQIAQPPYSPDLTPTDIHVRIKYNWPKDKITGAITSNKIMCREIN
jgi:hypothetical protein